jgi:hypothetical protein
MEEYIADENGHINVPGVQAIYPPGTRVFYVNGEYAGHETPVVTDTADTQPLTPLQGDAVQQVETPVQAEGE